MVPWATNLNAHIRNLKNAQNRYTNANRNFQIALRKYQNAPGNNANLEAKVRQSKNAKERIEGEVNAILRIIDTRIRTMTPTWLRPHLSRVEHATNTPMLRLAGTLYAKMLHDMRVAIIMAFRKHGVSPVIFERYMRNLLPNKRVTNRSKLR
jgi:superfamily II DNA or RNA helicase